MGKKRNYGGSEDSPDACFGAPDARSHSPMCASHLRKLRSCHPTRRGPGASSRSRGGGSSCAGVTRSCDRQQNAARVATTRAAQLRPPPPRSAPAAALARLPRRCLVREGAAASSVQQRSGRFEPIRVDLDLELAAHVRAAEGGGGPEVGAAWGHRCARDPGADIDELAGLHRQHSKSFQSKCSRVAAQRKAGDGRGRRACP